jgi:hypothetical protein
MQQQKAPANKLGGKIEAFDKPVKRSFGSPNGREPIARIYGLVKLKIGGLPGLMSASVPHCSIRISGPGISELILLAPRLDLQSGSLRQRYVPATIL